MTLCPPSSSSVLAFAGFTQNSEASGSVVGSFDLLCFSGVIITILESDSFTVSTGIGLSATRIYCEDVPCLGEPGHESVGSADSSALMAKMPYNGFSDPADTHQFQFSLDEADCFSSTSLLVALGGFVDLLMKNAAPCTAPNQS